MARAGHSHHFSVANHLPGHKPPPLSLQLDAVVLLSRSGKTRHGTWRGYDMRILFVTLMIACVVVGCGPYPGAPAAEPTQSLSIELPSVRADGVVSVERALMQRRSVREFSEGFLEMQAAAQLLWAAQGITADWGGRTAPSAGALYPLTVHMVVSQVDGLDAGLYRYLPESHRVSLGRHGELTDDLAQAALEQESIRHAAAILVLTAEYERTTAKYGERGIRYVHLEAGHAAQNVCLQATALELGGVVVGAFDDEAVRRFLGVSADETPLYLIPVGLPAATL